MSYIGNQVRSVPFITDVYSGNGADTTFGPLTIVPAGPASIMVFVTGSYRRPTLDYTLNGNYIVFDPGNTPGGGTNNIVIHHIGIGYMATQTPADGTVTTTKLGLQSVTGNTLGLNSISTNNFSASTNTSIIGKAVAAAIVFGG